MDPNHLGMEMFSTQPGIFNAGGDPIYANSFFPYEGLWWDGDTGREFIRGTNATATTPAIEKFNPSTGGTSRLYIQGNNLYDFGVHQANAGRPAFWGDILGDWREELVLVKNDFSGLRVFSSSVPAADRRRTLMHNAQYRVQATTKGYTQASHVDHYLGFETTEDPPPPIDDTDHTWIAGPTLDAATCPAGESLLFDLSGDHSTPVALSGSLAPSRLKVFSPGDYTFDGLAGSFGSTMDLVKSGAGTMTLTGSHSFTGPTEIWDGALLIDGTLTASPVTVHGGTWGGPLARGETGGRNPHFPALWSGPTAGSGAARQKQFPSSSTRHSLGDGGGGDPLECPCCKGSMKPVRQVIRHEEIEFFLRLHGLWEGIIQLPRPLPPPFDIDTMEPIVPPWQAIKEWIPDDGPDLDWFNRPRNPSSSDPDDFDQSPTWKPQEVPLGDGRTLVLEDS